MNVKLPTFVLINPSSRSGYSIKVWDRIRHIFDDAGAVYSVLMSDKEGGMTLLARRITEVGDEINIIVLGGDGTLNEVLNGIREFSKVHLGYIPTGSSNDFARSISLDDPEIAARMIVLNTEPIMRDICVATYHDLETDTKQVRYFNDALGLGLDGHSCWKANNSRLKKPLNRLGLGQVVYILSAARLILKNELTPMTLYIKNGDEVRKFKYDKTLFIVCMNYRYEGGGLQFCPEADGTDGILDVCALDNVTPYVFATVVPRVYKAGHVGTPYVHLHKCEQLVIDSEIPQYFHLDGEAFTKTDHIHIKILDEKMKWLN